MPRSRVLLVICSFIGALCATPALAVMSTSAEHALVMDGATGQVLWAKDGHSPMPPASMSKLMTLEILFQRIKDGRVKLNDRFPVSERAWRERSGSTMFVNIGDSIEVENLIRGIITQSGNDACIVVAEALGASVEGFVDIMNKRAKQIGLTNSHFVNPDGLDQPPGQMMTAYDLAKLARHLIYDYPRLYHYFSDRTFTWQGITQHNRNLVLDTFPGTDGLKTGHLESSGYGITVSAVRGAGCITTVFANSGGGIAGKDLPFLFERFFRADRSRSRSRDAGGAGIGLAIVKELIEAHGGEVGAESDPNQTRIWFNLPA